MIQPAETPKERFFPSAVKQKSHRVFQSSYHKAFPDVVLVFSI